MNIRSPPSGKNSAGTIPQAHLLRHPGGESILKHVWAFLQYYGCALEIGGAACCFTTCDSRSIWTSLQYQGFVLEINVLPIMHTTMCLQRFRHILATAGHIDAVFTNVHLVLDH